VDACSQEEPVAVRDEAHRGGNGDGAAVSTEDRDAELAGPATQGKTSARKCQVRTEKSIAGRTLTTLACLAGFKSESKEDTTVIFSSLPGRLDA
jgi:hypothetical protein